jgi:predicted amidohydrolase YtcJ
MIHATGDRANREVIDIYERAQAAVPAAERGVGEPRLRIEHLQIVHPDDLPRLARAGINASMEPSHAITDLHFAPSRLGVERLAGAYAWRDVLDTGVIIAGGSDAPVERGDPRIEFYATVARKDLQGYQAEGWHPEQAVTREEALKMFTIWGARAAFEEDIKGTLEPGKLADLTVFSKNIMAVPENEILNAETVMTIVGGEIVYERQ